MLTDLGGALITVSTSRLLLQMPTITMSRFHYTFPTCIILRQLLNPLKGLLLLFQLYPAGGQEPTPLRLFQRDSIMRTPMTTRAVRAVVRVDLKEAQDE